MDDLLVGKVIPKKFETGTFKNRYKQKVLCMRIPYMVFIKNYTPLVNDIMSNVL